MKKNLWLWGFTDSAETWNGRFAMIGFIAVICIEVIKGQGLLYLIGVMS
uniref:Ycf17 n=1 Tax=Pyropia endiviifolia TaxID=1699272 RepID=A0A1S5Q8E1_9RHOD|nr:ycf17 [Pyropia endiviifolia]